MQQPKGILDEFEKDGKIEQISKTGHFTYYQLK